MIQTYTDEMYYANNYLKGRKPVITTGFPFYVRSASQIVNRYTFNRLKDITEVPEEVQMCCCELAESEYRMEKQQKGSGEKASEKTGTYSVSFSNAQESV